MAPKARATNSGSSSVDPCIAKIEALWARGLPSDSQLLAKALRLLVFYTRTADGVPQKFQARVREKIGKLESLLEGMTLDDCIVAIPAIKYARRQLRTYVVYGTKFRAGITKADQAKAARIGQRIQLNPASLEDIKPADPFADHELDGVFPGGLDDENERD